MQSTIDSSNQLSQTLSVSWLEKLKPEFELEYMQKLKLFLAEEIKKYKIYPDHTNTFNAFKLCPLDQIKVVILGQDPYHGPGQAHGLCFSVQAGIQAPPSLQNIFKELNRDFGYPIAPTGDLSKWAQQGVFLLNTVLSVRAGEANSHAGQGWEQFTDQVIRIINSETTNTVFMLWGNPAKRKKEMIDANKHLILEAVHPSPLSAHRGFIGCGHFSKANQYLASKGLSPIDWKL